jgi:hypothetical protein
MALIVLAAVTLLGLLSWQLLCLPPAADSGRQQQALAAPASGDEPAQR